MLSMYIFPPKCYFVLRTLECNHSGFHVLLPYWESQRLTISLNQLSSKSSQLLKNLPQKCHKKFFHYVMMT